MQWFWFALTVVLLIVEIVSVQLVSIWFSAGALVAGLVTLCVDDINVGWQLFVFVVVSVVLLIATRPLVKKLYKGGTQEQKTNLDRTIGKVVVVTEKIDNVAGTGAVKSDGLEWSARSKDDSVIEENTLVTIVEIQGNKVIVSKKENNTI